MAAKVCTRSQVSSHYLTSGLIRSNHSLRPVLNLEDFMFLLSKPYILLVSSISLIQVRFYSSGSVLLIRFRSTHQVPFYSSGFHSIYQGSFLLTRVPSYSSRFYSTNPSSINQILISFYSSGFHSTHPDLIKLIQIQFLPGSFLLIQI